MSRMQGLFGLVVALLAIAPSAAAQQARGGASASGFQCPSCDSAETAAARQRWVDAQIATLTLDLARSRILYDNLQSRLAPDSPEPPRSPRERAELRAALTSATNEMNRITRELSARCGEEEPIRGYLGFTATQPISMEVSGGRTSTRVAYHIVDMVTPGSPAERAGIQAGDSIIAINRTDVRGRSFMPFLRQPGVRLNVTISRDGERREIPVTVGERPPTFGGACMQYRDYRFLDAAGQSVAMFRGRGAAGAGGTGGVSGASDTTGTRGGTVVRTRVGAGAGGRGSERVMIAADSMTQSTFILIPPAGPGAALFLSRGGTGAVVAGAEVSLVNGQLKTIFAVEHGALVTNVVPRTPAEASGIISGDVIVKANGENVTAISVLQRAIAGAREKRNVTLDVVRAKQPRQITLHW